MRLAKSSKKENNEETAKKKGIYGLHKRDKRQDNYINYTT